MVGVGTIDYSHRGSGAAGCGGDTMQTITYYEEIGMKTPAEQYAEVQALSSGGVLEELMDLVDFEERHAEYERRCNYKAREAVIAIADLITLSSRILKTGFTVEDHHELLKLLERIV